MPGRKLLLLGSDPLLFRVRVSYDDRSRIGGSLQIKGNLIQAGLGFVAETDIILIEVYAFGADSSCANRDMPRFAPSYNVAP